MKHPLKQARRNEIFEHRNEIWNNINLNGEEPRYWNYKHKDIIKREIAQKLQISHSTVHRDITFLRQQGTG